MMPSPCGKSGMIGTKRAQMTKSIYIVMFNFTSLKSIATGDDVNMN